MLRNGVGSRRWRSENMADLEFCSSAVKGEEVHVLAVDDSLVDRKVIEQLLKITSCKVTAVDSGRRALQFLGLDEEKSSSVGFDGLKVDLVITDYCMPGMTGYELLKKIKESSTLREIPVVIMSSENVMARIDRCLEEGAEDFLVKPVKLADVKRLREYMTTTRDVRTRRGEDDDTSSNNSNNSNKRKLRDSCSHISLSSSSESEPSPPSISSSPSSMSILSSSPSPSPSPSPPSLSPSPSVVLSSSAPSSPSSSPLDSPTAQNDEPREDPVEGNTVILMLSPNRNPGTQ